jgi:hypothetical protein
MIKIPLRDKHFSHCIYSNNPLPPTSFSKYIEWKRIEAHEGDENTVYTDSCLEECKGGIGWILEPYELDSKPYNYVINNRDKFKEIWSHDREFINKVNGTYVPYGGCWINRADFAIHPKTKNFSIIASGKRLTTGHYIRHNIVAAAGSNIDVYGRSFLNTPGYNEIKNKIEGLKNYRFHFAIENCKKDTWFTEKLIDCFVTGTVPIYWGSSTISEFFNTDGIIMFDNLLDLKQKLKLCTPDYYERKMPAIKENFELAKKYLLAEDWIYNNIKLNQNNYV